MGKTLKTLLLSIILLLVCMALALLVYMRYDAKPAAEPTPEPTATPTPTPTPTPEPEFFTISFVGDNTLSSSNINSSFTNTINGDMKYPYSNTLDYFKDDDLTVANLECVFSDKTLYSNEMFSFKSPASYAQILSEGSVEFVTMANNHSKDFGEEGYSDTCVALDACGISHAGENDSIIFETKSGLKVGIYCAYSYVSTENVEAGVKMLRDESAEYIICALHWGEEGTYTPTDLQTSVAYAAIDAGANVVYGSHSHVLQPYEEYNGGIIFYSLGNWSFGGNTYPKDMDTAIAQVTIKRTADGAVSTEAFELIPCCMSSSSGLNDFRPTPYEKDSKDYKRAMSKLYGTFAGGNLNVDYSFMYSNSETAGTTGVATTENAG